MKYVQNKDILTTELEESLMMMSIEAGKYFELNPVSKRIWDLLDEPKTEEEIIAVLLSEYDVPEKQCSEEVSEHLSLLKQKKIILTQ